MELKEISATNVSPYRCYVRGNIIQTEGENVHTIGFKDGIAVLQVIPPATDMQKFTDNMFDSKSIDLTKLKKIIVKIDPKTGKKYIYKDGKKIEILPQITNPILNIKPPDSLKLAPISKASDSSLFIKTSQGFNFGNGPLPKLVPTGSLNMKVFDNVKYHVLSMNMKKPGGGSSRSTMTDCDSSLVDKSLQTDTLDRKEVCTQTEPFSIEGRTSPFSETFFNFILGSDDGDGTTRKMIDPNKLRTKEEIHKFNFFNDMRNALNFDRSGNLPIHDSVIQNSLKAVQKNCVVLRAVKETANVLNQHFYAPLHLAVLHDVNLEILKVLLDHGADLGLADPEGNTAIHLAIEHRRSAMLKILINGAVETRFNLDIFNYEGFTPLILACLNHSYEDAKVLLQNGADPNVKDMKSGRTALFHASEGHDVDLVELLMHYKADTKIRNFFGTSPHDAMFELEEMPLKIKFCILGREHQRFQNKKKIEGKSEPNNMKKAKLQTTPVLKKVSSSDLMCKPRRK